MFSRQVVNTRMSITFLAPRIQDPMAKKFSIFDEKYRVVAIDGDRLVIRGVSTGDILTIVNPEPATPLTHADFPPGKLIALSDPSLARPN